MLIVENKSTDTNIEILVVDGNSVEEVKTFKYLGVTESSSADLEHDLGYASCIPKIQKESI